MSRTVCEWLACIILMVAAFVTIAACVPGWPRTIDIHIAAPLDGGTATCTESK